MEPDYCPCSATDGKCVLESDPCRRLAVYQLVKSLQKTYDGVLVRIVGSVFLGDNIVEKTRCYCEMFREKENYLAKRLATRGALELWGE